MIWTVKPSDKHSVMVMAGEIKGSMDDCSYRFNNEEACYCGLYMGPLLTTLRSGSWPPFHESALWVLSLCVVLHHVTLCHQR